jgi:hypothetical protein
MYYKHAFAPPILSCINFSVQEILQEAGGVEAVANLSRISVGMRSNIDIPPVLPVRQEPRAAREDGVRSVRSAPEVQEGEVDPRHVVRHGSGQLCAKRT